jgi:hypothetical protein
MGCGASPCASCTRSDCGSCMFSQQPQCSERRYPIAKCTGRHLEPQGAIAATSDATAKCFVWVQGYLSSLLPPLPLHMCLPIYLTTGCPQYPRTCRVHVHTGKRSCEVMNAAMAPTLQITGGRRTPAPQLSLAPRVCPGRNGTPDREAACRQN